jgi:hypothetical protein
MKKIVFLLLVIAGFSCKKDDPNCYACKIDSVSTLGTGTTIIRQYHTTDTQCGLSASDALNYESSRTGTVITHEQNGIYGVITVTTISSCRCIKQ